MISVIVPVYNEAMHVQHTIEMLRKNDVEDLVVEIIISDGGSSDNTIEFAASAGATVIQSPRKGRAAQMNHGAAMATGRILYFLHADTIPPAGFSSDIVRLVRAGTDAGCFMLSFDLEHWFLKAHSWFTRFDINAIRFGDQSLFVTKTIFTEAGGFNERLIVMEDQDIVKRIRKFSRFVVIKKPVLTSARKYVDNGVYKTQFVFYLIFLMHRLGYSQQKLVKMYRKLLRQDKV